MSEAVVKRQGGVVTPLNPSTVEDAFRMAKAIHQSGLAPSGYKSAEAVFVAMQMGSELGLAPMAAVQNITVISGRPSMEAAAMVGVAESTGKVEWIKHKFEGEGEKRRCIVWSKRGDKAEECSPSEYSMLDAKRAGLLGKDNWQKYPDRMLLARARGYHMRDNYKDVLLGLASITTEEIIDMGVRTARDITPTQGTASQRLAESLDDLTEPEVSQEESAPAEDSQPVEVIPLSKEQQEVLELAAKLHGWDDAALNQFLAPYFNGWGLHELDPEMVADARRRVEEHAKPKAKGKKGQQDLV